MNGEQLIFSNTDLLKSRIRNFKRMQERRVVLTIGTVRHTGHGGAHPEHAREAVEAQQQVRFDRSHFMSYGESAQLRNGVLRVDGRLPGVRDTNQAVNLAIFRRFTAEKISFAFPTRTIVVRGPAPETIGAAS